MPSLGGRSDCGSAGWQLRAVGVLELMAPGAPGARFRLPAEHHPRHADLVGVPRAFAISGEPSRLDRRPVVEVGLSN